ncbi:pyridoxamine 5'-phosphate oxidase family protein [Zavarzinella formosa]|uniref:pyridoxamine 5'-phosphate oxidase family protein n=1 Tax=Zavarzinella formosa TaxID=360055 RepID=UPI0003615544|nr:pyridoxamine 5'-phosphate oxidase family protein [Zavarzinella formosa]
MLIREMSREECFRALAGSRLARLACSRENQPYVVPVYLALHEASECLYGFTTFGQKVEWMRANPLVCVETGEVAANNQWVSVIAFGRYEELPERPGNDKERLMAWQVLKTDPMWWEPGDMAWTARASCDPTETLTPVYYRIRIGQMTGREAAQATRIERHVTPPG